MQRLGTNNQKPKVPAPFEQQVPDIGAAQFLKEETVPKESLGVSGRSRLQQR